MLNFGDPQFLQQLGHRAAEPLARAKLGLGAAIDQFSKRGSNRGPVDAVEVDFVAALLQLTRGTAPEFFASAPRHAGHR